MTLLERQLEQYCEFVDEMHGNPTTVEMSGRPTEVVGTPRRRNGVFAAIGAAVVVIVAFGGVAMLSSSRSELPVSDPAPLQGTAPIVATTPTTLAQVESPVVDEPPAAAPPQPFTVIGEVDIAWIRSTGNTPDEIDLYDSGEYFNLGDEGGIYRSNDGIAWSFEATPGVPDWASDNGEWAVFDQRLYAGVLARMTDGGWVSVGRPSQANQTGDWLWTTRHLATSGDILIVPGGTGEARSELPETSHMWRIEGDGPWELIGQPPTAIIEANPSGGFLYDDATDGNRYISDDGLEWTVGGPTEVQVWNDGDLFPGLEYSFRGTPDDIQVWTSPDGSTWTFEFALPPTTDRNWWRHYGVDLHRTNRGIVATSNMGSDESPAVEFWLLNEGGLTWTKLTMLPVPSDQRDFVASFGAIGDLLFVQFEGPSISETGEFWIAAIP